MGISGISLASMPSNLMMYLITRICPSCNREHASFKWSSLLKAGVAGNDKVVAQDKMTFLWTENGVQIEKLAELHGMKVEDLKAVFQKFLSLGFKANLPLFESQPMNTHLWECAGCSPHAQTYGVQPSRWCSRKFLFALRRLAFERFRLSFSMRFGRQPNPSISQIKNRSWTLLDQLVITCFTAMIASSISTRAVSESSEVAAELAALWIPPKYAKYWGNLATFHASQN